jgi:hypothetical protein
VHLRRSRYYRKKAGRTEGRDGEGFVADGPAIVDVVMAADEIPNLLHVDFGTLEHFALPKIKEAVHAVTGA